jgi:hypothetical protein
VAPPVILAGTYESATEIVDRDVLVANAMALNMSANTTVPVAHATQDEDNVAISAGSSFVSNNR